MKFQIILLSRRAEKTATKRRALSRWVSAAAGVSLFFGVVAASFADGANVVVDAGGISATATVDATSMTLRVGGPGGFRDEVRSQGGYVNWNLPGGALSFTFAAR